VKYIILLFLLSGCVASSQHVKDGDRKTARFADKVSDGFKILAQNDEKYAYVYDSIAESSQELQEHAKKPAGIDRGLATGGNLLSMLMAVAGGGLPALLFAGKKILDCNKTIELAKDCADLQPEDARKKLISSKIKI